jgi:hypothetical protein
VKIEHIQKGKFYPFIHIFRCFYSTYFDILDVEEWCKDNTYGKWYRSATVYSYGFIEPFFFDLLLNEEDDAILFKLIWC